MANFTYICDYDIYVIQGHDSASYIGSDIVNTGNLLFPTYTSDVGNAIVNSILNVDQTVIWNAYNLETQLYNEIWYSDNATAAKINHEYAVIANWNSSLNAEVSSVSVWNVPANQEISTFTVNLAGFKSIAPVNVTMGSNGPVVNLLAAQLLNGTVVTFTSSGTLSQEAFPSIAQQINLDIQASVYYTGASTVQTVGDNVAWRQYSTWSLGYNAAPPTPPGPPNSGSIQSVIIQMIIALALIVMFV